MISDLKYPDRVANQDSKWKNKRILTTTFDWSLSWLIESNEHLNIFSKLSKDNSGIGII